MGRKKPGFEWVAEGEDGEVAEKVERPSRSAEKRRRKRIEGLVERMAQLSPGQRAALDLDPGFLEALEAVVAAGTRTDRKRLLGHAVSWVVDLEAETLETALGEARG
jgi:ribosomal 50S subunit-associated protein YjgA (DUF615 family)